MMLSIITINYNDKFGLEKTILSVKNQTLSSFEYIVIDGGSTDGSKELIEQYNDTVDHWISEPDKGIYQAMNKGIDKSTGDYLLFLNSGDVLFSENCLEKFTKSPLEKDLIFGDLQMEKNSGLKIKKYPDKINFSYMVSSSLPHPATLIKKNLFALLGNYDENIKIIADWKFFLLAICKHNTSYEHRKIIVSSFNLTGISSLKENQEQIKLERNKILTEHFPVFIEDALELKKNRKLQRRIKNTPILNIIFKRYL